MDLLVTGKTLEELAVNTTISEILSDTDTYHAEYVELEVFVIAINDEDIVIADVNNDLTNDTLTIIDDGTGYIDNLTRGSQYKFLIQVIIADVGNLGRLLAEPIAVED